MDPKVVLAVTWIFAGLVVAAYIWFVVWRFRVERRKKAAQATSDDAMSDVIARTAQRLSSAPPLGVPSASSVPAASAAVAPTPAAAASAPAATAAEPPLEPVAATVAGLVSGIVLPHDLVPLTTIAPRSAAGDRVAFWTASTPAEVVGPAFASELERLGYTVIARDERSLSAQRDDDRLLVMIHPDGATAIIGDQMAFPSVPEVSVVIEVWVPA
jgi:hypothetical protein